MITQTETNGSVPLDVPVSHAAPSELTNLIADVEDLLKKIANAAGMSAAKDTLVAGGRRVAATARNAAGATDDYVRASPWQAIGLAALAGVGVGFLLARR